MQNLRFKVPKWSWHGTSCLEIAWECCEFYPCEKCGGTHIDAIHSHIENFQGSTEQTTNDITLEETDIEAIPVCSKCKKQNFDDLVMDDEGNIDVEESVDEYNCKDNTKKLLAEDEYEIIPT